VDFHFHQLPLRKMIMQWVFFSKTCRKITGINPPTMMWIISKNQCKSLHIQS
jgi:hypothetical protein